METKKTVGRKSKKDKELRKEFNWLTKDLEEWFVNHSREEKREVPLQIVVALEFYRDFKTKQKNESSQHTKTN